MSGSWFDDAGLGMFVHWDHASVQGLEISWPLVGGLPLLPHCQSVTVEQYHSSAASFDPADWDPRALARLAREAGMRYVVLTAKHHSGYAMFHTKLTDFSIEHSAYGRDIVAGFVEAVRDEGLRAGLYYSLSDWSHPDYPAFTEEHKPYLYMQSPPFPGDERWARYMGYLQGQVRELLSNYGRIDLIWFDGGWERPQDAWRPSELEDLIRTLQPDILINDRLPGAGDFRTPEQFVPAQAPAGRWETCMTMNSSWGYVPEDTSYKSARTLVHTICEVRARGGNLLLNVSPTGSGALPPEQTERLRAVAAWMDANGEAIHDARPGLEPWQFYGPSTRRGDTVYLHLVMRPYEAVTVRGIPIHRLRGVRELATGTALTHVPRLPYTELFNADPRGEVTIAVPAGLVGEHATVLAVEIAQERVPIVPGRSGSQAGGTDKRQP